MKRVMNSVLASEVHKGKSVQTGPNTLEKFNSILNRQCGWAKNDVSAYETVFGIDFDPIMPDTRQSQHPQMLNYPRAQECGSYQ